MGERGQRPVFFPVVEGSLTQSWLNGILEIPGVMQVPGGLTAAWDIAWVVARLLRIPEPPVPSWDGPMSGLTRYRALGLHEKTWPSQKEDILFLARRAWAVLAEPMRSGKTLMALAAAILVDSRKTLIICPKYARLGWADEVQNWTGEAAVLLCGRGAREIRVRCLACRGRGEVAGGSTCDACRARNGQSYGYRIYDVPALEPQVSEYIMESRRWRRPKPPGSVRLNLLPLPVQRQRVRYCKLPCTLVCPRHADVVMPYDKNMTGVPHCGRCQEELMDALRRARFVIVNYELLVTQHIDAGAGVIVGRKDLAGWVDTLKNISFDVAICDEAQMLRGWTTSMKRRGEARNERTLELVGHVGDRVRIPRVWMVTGTPFYGFTRDIFWLLEIASGGLFGGDTRMRGRKFMVRYCEGKKTSHGFQAKGRSVFAETELMRRLNGTLTAEGKRNFDGIMIQRTREELGFTAPMQRFVKHLEVDGVQPFMPGRSKRGMDIISKLIVQTSALKREALMDKFMDELAEGNKIVVFTYHVPSAKRTFLAFEKELNTAARRTRMREVNAKCWLATGPQRKRKETDETEHELEPELTDEQKKNWARDGDQRYRMAEVFREHVGAGVIVATIDSMPGALSLRGASSVHFLDLHWSPGAIAQAENRPWYPEVKDLSVIYYIARGSVDDHIEAEVLPKAETLARMGREKGAEAMLEAFSKPDETRTVEAIWNRLMRHLRVPVTDGLDGEAE